MNQIKERVAGIFNNYDHQGIHRTGTKTDTESAHWLAGEIQSAGLTPILTRFSIDRIDPVQAGVVLMQAVGLKNCCQLSQCGYSLRK